MSAAPDFREIQRRQLGAAIRRRRHGRGLTLAQLSATAGVSVSMLSQVERGLLDPSLDSLRNIAEALGTSPFRLLEEEGTVAGIVRRGSGRTIVQRGRRVPVRAAVAVARRSIRDRGVGAGAGPLQRPASRARIRARRRTCSCRGARGSRSATRRWSSRAGDCITFDPTRPHRVTALGDEVVICVDVISPPTF